MSFTTFDPEILKYVANEMVEEAGAKVLFHSYVSSPIVEESKVKGVMVENKSGRQAILAKVVIDATGDGDLAAAAGAPFEIRETEMLQPGTLMFRMGNVKIDEIRRYVKEHQEDVVQDRKFEDGIAMFGYFMDVHHPKGRHQPFHGGPEKGFDIPYRCLLPKKLENLLVAGRCISTTFEAQGAIRVMAPCMAMGQAAGTAAALAVREGVTPRQLDVQKLREVLMEQDVCI